MKITTGLYTFRMIVERGRRVRPQAEPGEVWGLFVTIHNYYLKRFRATHYPVFSCVQTTLCHKITYTLFIEVHLVHS